MEQMKINQEIILDFVDRCQDHLWAIETELLNLEQGDTEAIRPLLLSVGSIRVEAENLGLTPIHNIAHYLVRYFQNLRDYHLKSDQELITLLFRLVEILQKLVNQLVTFSEKAEMNPWENETQSIRHQLTDRLIELMDSIQFFNELDRICPIKDSAKKIAADYGKQVEVILIGGKVAMSQKLLKHLPRVLTHLLNNAIGHGIEIPDVREAAGKSPVGKITLQAFNLGNQIAISFADDGAGINCDRVKAKAIDKGLITKLEADLLSDEEIYEFLFHPDFTTRTKRDLIAGTGFGLNIVRKEVQKLNGKIFVTSTPGKETRFQMTYPAIIED
jgi:chemotaxis protein histidine kinase CheA